MTTFKLTVTNTLMQPAKIIDRPEQMVTYLQELHPDLTPELFLEAIRAGLEERNEVTHAWPPTAAGIKQWMATVYGLRTLLSERHWHLHDYKNCPYISSPDRSIAIVVMTGDPATGKSEGVSPTNQAEKGNVAKGFIEQNRQLELFNQASFEFVKKACVKKPEETYVWVLLYHYDKKANEVRFELSLPNDFSKKKITAWSVRLILGSQPNSAVDFSIHKDEPSAPATVDVAPKAERF